MPEGRAVLAAPTVAEFTAVWLKDVKGRRSFATHQRYEGVIRLYVLPTFGSIRMKDLNPYSAEQWQLEMAQMLHRKTVNTHFGVFQKCLNDAVRWRKLSFNPLASVQPMAEPEQEIRFLTADELAKLLAHVRDLDYGAFAIFAVAAMTGMRLAEVQGLKWDCISFQTGKITVKRIWDSKARKLKETTKTKTIRVIPMAQDLQQLLISLANEKDAADFLFFGVDRLRFNFHGAAKVLRGFCRGAGVPEIRFHDLRHSFASNFVMAGGSSFRCPATQLSASILRLKHFVICFVGETWTNARKPNPSLFLYLTIAIHSLLSTAWIVPPILFSKSIPTLVAVG